MKLPDELNGEPVLANNKIGTIAAADLENDEITINFKEDGQASFSMDEVLVLRVAAKIRVDAENDFTLMPFWDYADIMEIIMFADSTQAGYRKQAVTLSQKNSNALEYTMHSLRDHLELKRRNIISR